MTSFRLRILAQVLPFLLVTPGLALAQAQPTRAEAEAALNAPANLEPAGYTPQQIDQLVASIALYPDELLSQVLMAATYPQQIIDAAQWLADPNNAGLRGDALAAALEPLPWDPSVKALVAFPQVVAMMNQHIEWTQALGVAFATQQPQVMAQIQVLRGLAMRSGRLSRVHHLVFRREGPDIIIVAAEQNEVYVPVYNPVTVYGDVWPAPDYPPVYMPPPPDFVGETVAPGFQLGVGYAVVARLWGWSRPDWRDHRITINRGDYTRITHDARVGPGNAWRHQGPVVLAAPQQIEHIRRERRAAAVPAGTVDPGRAAAVAALPKRAAGEPARIRTGTPPPAAAQTPHPVGHPPAAAEAPHPAAAATHEQATTTRPAEHRPAPAVHEQAARPATPPPQAHPAVHEQAARPATPPPQAHPAVHEQAARPATPPPQAHPAMHEQAARPAAPPPQAHPAMHEQAAHPATPPQAHPAVHEQAARPAAPPPQAHPAVHEQAARPAAPPPQAHPAVHEQAARPAAPPPQAHPAVHEQAARPATPPPQAHPAAATAAAEHRPAHPGDKPENKKD